MLRAAREDQVKNKEHFLAVQAARDRAEFERVLKWVPLLFTNNFFLRIDFVEERNSPAAYLSVLAGICPAKETAENIIRFWRAFVEAPEEILETGRFAPSPFSPKSSSPQVVSP